MKKRRNKLMRRRRISAGMLAITLTIACILTPVYAETTGSVDQAEVSQSFITMNEEDIDGGSESVQKDMTVIGSEIATETNAEMSTTTNSGVGTEKNRIVDSNVNAAKNRIADSNVNAKSVPATESGVAEEKKRSMTAGADIETGQASDEKISEDVNDSSKQEEGKRDEIQEAPGEIEETQGEIQEEQDEEQVEQTEEKDCFMKLPSDSKFSESDLAQMDFSSRRLLIAVNAQTDIIDPSHIQSVYRNVYLLEYESVEETGYAYANYYGKTIFVEADRSIQTAEPESETPEAEFTEINETTDTFRPVSGDTPLEQLKVALEQGEQNVQAKQDTPIIALIDTGVSSESEVTSAVSVIGDNVWDDHGHGTRVAGWIREENPGAQILSIKAMDASGTGTVASLYAAIMFAIEAKVSYINLSLSAPAVQSNAALRSIIGAALAEGITIIGAAGNQGQDAAGYVPGCFSEILVAGACDETGTRRQNSNYGSTVDFLVVADSTSEAAARLTGHLSANGSVEADGELIFLPEEMRQEEVTAAEISEKADTYRSFPMDKKQEIVVRYLFADQSQLEVADTIDSMMCGTGEKILTQFEMIQPAYRNEEGKLCVPVDLPISNGLSTEIREVVFANGNNHGELISEGVALEKESLTAIIDADVLDKEKGDFSNLQLQVLVPYDQHALARIPVEIVAKNRSESMELELSPYDFPTMLLRTEDQPEKKKMQIFCNGDSKALDEDGFSFDSETGYLSLNVYAAMLKSLSIHIDGKLSDDFVVAAADGGDIPSGVLAYLSDQAAVAVYRLIQAGTGTSASVTLKVGNVSTNAPEDIVSGKYTVYFDGKTNPGLGFLQDKATTVKTGSVSLPTSITFNGITVPFQLYREDRVTSHGNFGAGWNRGMAVTCRHIAGNYNPPTADNQYFSGTVRLIHIAHATGDDYDLTFAVETNGALYPTAYSPASSQSVGRTFKLRAKAKKPKGTLTLKKSFADTGIAGNANYRLSGAVYGVFSDAACTKQVATLTTDSVGNTSSVTLDAGTYYVKEQTPSTGCELDVTVHRAEVVSDTTVTVSSKEPVQRIKLALQKKSTDPSLTDGNRCYSLQGAVYTVYTDISCTKAFTTMTTDASGHASCATTLPLGRYWVKETTAPKGYLYNPQVVQLDFRTVNAAVKTSAGIYSYTMQTSETPGNDPLSVLLVKKDAETGTAQAMARLEGAQYTVKYFDVDCSVNPEDSGEKPKYTWVFQTDADGILHLRNENLVSGPTLKTDGATGNVILPVGTVTLQETKTPIGYMIDPQIYVAQIKLQETTINGRITRSVVASNFPNSETAGALEPIIRGNLAFQKVDESNTPMAGIPFLITSMTTGESHVVVTDADGKINTAEADSSVEKNSNDQYIKRNEKGGLYVEPDDEEYLNAAAGIWFGETTATDETKGVLLFDNYLIEEVAVSGNFHKTLKSAFFQVTDVGTVYPQTEVWVNKVPVLTSEARNADDSSSQMLPVADLVTVKDTISCTNLVSEQTYTAKGKLVFRDRPDVVVAEDEIEFKPGEPVVLNYQFSTADAAGSAYVSFVELYDRELLRTVHADVNDEAQTVYVPAIDTELQHIGTGDRVGVRSAQYMGENIPENANSNNATATASVSDENLQDKGNVLTDIVRISHLQPDSEEQYVIRGELMDKATGQIVSEAESEVFTAADFADMEVEVSFPVNSEGEESVYVAFETLYKIGEENEILLTSHSDPENGKQTVVYSSGHTQALTVKNGWQQALAEENLEIIDHVWFENLIEGEEYTVRGELHYKEDFDANGNGIVEADEPKAGDEVVGQNKAVYTFTVSESLESQSERVRDLKVTELADGLRTYSGCLLMPISVDASTLAGQNLVVFETFLHNGVEVYAHHNLDDQAQTIRLPAIGTSASAVYFDEKGKTIEVVNDEDQSEVAAIPYSAVLPKENKDADEQMIVIEDIVSYKNLVSENDNQKYWLFGVLMDAETGEPLKDVDGNEYQSVSELFTADETGSGTETVRFALPTGKFLGADGDSILSGKRIVVFEELYRVDDGEKPYLDVADTNSGENDNVEGEVEKAHIEKSRVVAAHQDLTSEEQTVRFADKPASDLPNETIKQQKTAVKTGEKQSMLFFIIADLLAAVACGAFLWSTSPGVNKKQNQMT